MPQVHQAWWHIPVTPGGSEFEVIFNNKSVCGQLGLHETLSQKENEKVIRRQAKTFLIKPILEIFLLNNKDGQLQTNLYSMAPARRTM